MKNSYYNEHEFRYILNSLDKNPLLTRKKIEEYLEKYPKDYLAYIYYAHILIVLGFFDEAETILDNLENIINDKKFKNNIPKSLQDKNKFNIISTRLSLLAYQEKYIELQQYYNENIHSIKQMDLELNPLMFYCRKKLGLIDSERRDKHSYLFKQIVQYKESDFLEHIKKHLADYNQNVEEPNPCIFNFDFPITEILTEIKKYIPSDKRLCSNFYVNVYVFKYDGCGKVNGESVNYFKIVCFHNTNDIITVYPDVDCQALPYTDLNYMNKYYSSPKTLSLKHKGLSQIEKFNQRYGKIKI